MPLGGHFYTAANKIRLLEFFIAEVTARTAADLLGIQPNSAARFYRKIRQIIMFHLD